MSDGAIRPCDIAVIGEAPGAEEDESGIPFVGKSGKKLRYYMKEFAGIILGRDAVVLNAVSCRPPGNRRPEATEIETCSIWLRKNLSIIKPKLVLLVGKTAAESMLNWEGVRGRFYGQAGFKEPWKSFTFEAMHIYHPSYLDRKHDPSLNFNWAEQIEFFSRSARRLK